MAISAALIVLSFLELPEDRQPPPNIWHHAERLEEWFAAMRERDKNPGMEPIRDADGDMEQNELTKELLG